MSLKKTIRLPPYIIQTAPSYFPVYREAQAADNDQEDCGEIYDDVFPVSAEAVAAQKVDAGVTKSGYRMENAVPDSFDSEPGYEYEEITDGADALENQRDFENPQSQPYQSG